MKTNGRTRALINVADAAAAAAQTLTKDEREFIVNIMGQIQVNAGDEDAAKVVILVQSIKRKLSAPVVDAKPLKMIT